MKNQDNNSKKTSKWNKKIILFHREIELKVVLEIFAIYFILALILIAIYYLDLI